MANGLYTNAELVDSIIVDLNSVIAKALDGQYIQACGTITQIAQKLVNLRTTIDRDLQSRDAHIEDLKAELRACGHEVIDVPEQDLTKDGV